MSAEHEPIENALPAYLLGISDPEEAQMVRSHLAGCPTCQVLARQMRRTIDEIPLAVERAAPPAKLRDQILAAAAAQRPAVRSSTGQVPPRRRSRPIFRLPSGLTGRALPVAAAAVVAFALGAGLGLGLGRTAAPPATAVAQYSLAGSGAMTGATAKVYELKSEQLTFVAFEGLPQPADGKIYELWLIPQTGQPVAAGVFSPDTQGSHIQVLARDLRGFKELAVTQEVAPAGTTAPTQQPQLAGTIG